LSPKTSPPSDTMVECPIIPKDGKYDTFGDVWQRLDELTDMYIECRLRHKGLIEYNKESK